jgi:hypothetical protein
MKVKIFHGIDLASIEMNVNEWLKSEKPKVEKVIQTQCYNQAAKSVDIVLSIWYEGQKKAGFGVA